MGVKARRRGGDGEFYRPALGASCFPELPVGISACAFFERTPSPRTGEHDQGAKHSHSRRQGELGLPRAGAVERGGRRETEFSPALSARR